jgi:hypothetical protein
VFVDAFSVIFVEKWAGSECVAMAARFGLRVAGSEEVQRGRDCMFLNFVEKQIGWNGNRRVP